MKFLNLQGQGDVKCDWLLKEVPGYGGCRFGAIVLGDSGARITFIVTHWNLERTCSWVGPVCFCLQICSVVGPGRIDSENRTFMRANVKAQHAVWGASFCFFWVWEWGRVGFFIFSFFLMCSQAPNFFLKTSSFSFLNPYCSAIAQRTSIYRL